MTTPTVSVVMVVFNGERFLREAVESILSQAFCDFEFIIIDDGSIDGTAAILASYAQSDPRMRVHHQEHSGIPESRNRGQRLARGKYIAILDADDIALGHRLMRQVEFLEKHDEVGLLGGAMEYIDATGKTLATRRYPLEDHELRLMLQRDTTNVFVNSGLVMRKDIVYSVGGYRRPFAEAEDYDLWVRMARQCKLANLGEVVVKHRVHPDSVTHRKVKQLTMCLLAGQALASSGGNGWQDQLLDSVSEITPSVLATLGVDEATVQGALAANYRNVIEAMCRVGQKEAALRLTKEMLRASGWEHIEKRKRFIADNWLRAAGLYWGQEQYLQSLAAAGRAVMIRPIVGGRPLKRLLDRLNDALRVEKRANAAGTN